MVQPGGVPKDIAALAAEIVRSCSDDALRRTALELLEGIIHRLTRSELTYEIEPPWRVTDALMFSIEGSEFFDAGVDDARCDFGSMAFLVVVSEGFEGDGVLGPIGSRGYDGSIFLHRG